MSASFTGLLLAQIALGCVSVACILAGGVLAGNALVARAATAASASERVADLVVAVAFVIAVVGQGLGFAGALTPWSLALGCASAGVVGALVARDTGLGRLRASFAAAGRALRRPGPLWCVALLAAWLVARALRWPDLSWDALTYHLTYPAFWLHERGFERFEAGGIWDQYESFPKAGELFFYAALAPFHADALVGLTNLPFWLGLGAAVKGSAQRLGCSARASDWSAALVLLCPALSAYVNPAYVEVPVACAVAAAISAGARAVQGDRTALLPLGMALGLAAALKTTGLSFLPFGAVAALACARSGPLGAWARAAGLGALALLLVAGPWYLANAWLCGNPLYPAPLPGATDGPGAGSLASAWAIAEGSVLRQGMLGVVFGHLAVPPWRVPYPLGPGWLYVLGLPGCLLLGLAFARGARALVVAVLAALAVALLLIYVLSPWNGVFAEANTRFLAPSLIAAVLGCAVALGGAPRWAAVAVTACGAAAVLLALAASRLLRELPGLGPALLVGAALAVTAFGAAMASDDAGTRGQGIRRAGRRLATGAALCALLALPFALAARREGRAAAYAEHTGLHPGRPRSALWNRVSQLPPGRIAFAVGGINATEGWFFYPLFGADLRHRVRYVDIERADTRACLRRGNLRAQPDVQAWTARLRQGAYDYLVTDGSPLELSWALERPRGFSLRFEAGGTRLFAIDRAHLR